VPPLAGGTQAIEQKANSDLRSERLAVPATEALERRAQL